MSDPAKSASEIEDVLASIRRLVSESQAAPARPAAAVPASASVRPRSADRAAPPGKLVLTPSLRVTDPDDPWAPVPVKDAEAPAADIRDDDAEADASWGLEDRLSDWGEIEESADEAVADAIADQQAPPFHRAPRFSIAPADANPEADPESDPDREFDEAPDAAELSDLAELDGIGAGDLADFEPETGDVDWPDRSAGSALRDLALARGHGLEAPDGDSRADPDPDGDTPADAMAPPAVPHAVSHDHAAAQVVTKIQRPIPDEADSTMTPEPPADDAAPAGRRAPIFSRRVDVKRAAPPQEPPRARTVDAADMLGMSDMSDMADAEDDEIEDLGEAPSPFTFPETEEGLLDEETLRDIIAEVVREELQGAMGQRITRNVRKMVRREIRLALAAEDLE